MRASAHSTRIRRAFDAQRRHGADSTAARDGVRRRTGRASRDAMRAPPPRARHDSATAHANGQPASEEERRR
ncbi:hypothetical protein AQ765_21865 [Burkholderia pseudomallei]|nr:hypothetical protein [Burkholderia pseudomallei]AYX28812.1 hypothetical protein EGY16_12480 [Burkholderia pseudomallei]MDV2128797.1 hypothetical protein [Burkholderia pseudomallei]MDV2230006.1 hypothetical protein [Burkholderia pseudomallei]OMT94895.1 hypothetical protein AQ765_21865 [Burkholderia pseudomallei]ONC68463.1 hypothetical protein AQ922_19080 [Burkholderia pseudomallei]